MGSAKPSRRGLLLAGAGGLAVAATAPYRATAATAATARAARAAGPVEPDIDGTGVWRARPPRRPVSVLDRRPDRIVVHHTVSANSPDTSRAQAHRHAHWVQDLHMDDNGWLDTGYHFLNSRGGWITEGRHRSLETLRRGNGLVLGSHTRGQNERAVGIANEGAYHAGAWPPRAQWEVLVVLCAYVCHQYGVAPQQIYGHKDFGDTLCPGVLHDLLPRLRTEVAARLR
ncbi:MULTISPECIES: peptidoglycan recognition protein family protein [Streptomyces]|uniref:peptidoglycan recognition protein family protein n=1 Tax=Streptomyces TaxID=1883 RepID=UPI00224975BC|nr:peptidoglycan recognition family protein [Streptomyces sp. JHD 1]MCX2970979.1 peptidoglycan recognition family protein [Streptomyces sp. JHD 1]